MTMTEQEKKYLKEIGCSEKEIARRELEERIDKAQMAYCQENLVSGSQLSTTAWTEIYKMAGMTDEEIKAYREERQKYSAALDDPLDAYRD